MACLDLDPDYVWIKGWGSSQIHFLYSWTCGIHEGDFSYRYLNGDIEVVEYSRSNGSYDGFPYDNYPLIFDPKVFDLEAVGTDDQDIILKLNSPDCDSGFIFSNPRADFLSMPAHQFGGVPYLAAGNDHQKNCVLCKNEMHLIASISNESYSDNEGFSGNDFVQVVYWICPSCQVVSAQNFCD